jgi:hypothetical protein
MRPLTYTREAGFFRTFTADKFFTLFLHQPEEVLLSCRLIGNRV